MQLLCYVIVRGCRDTEFLEIGIRSLSTSVHLVKTDTEGTAVELLCHADIIVSDKAFLKEVLEVVLVGDERQRDTLARLRVYRAVVLDSLPNSAG